MFYMQLSVGIVAYFQALVVRLVAKTWIGSNKETCVWLVERKTDERSLRKLLIFVK